MERAREYNLASHPEISEGLCSELVKGLTQSLFHLKTSNFRYAEMTLTGTRPTGRGLAYSREKALRGASMEGASGRALFMSECTCRSRQFSVHPAFQHSKIIS